MSVITLPIPFGKYRGRTVRFIVQDGEPTYAFWRGSCVYPEHATSGRRLLVHRLKAELEAEELV